MVNYYEILGIDPGSSEVEIKKSFRRRAKQLHPDLRASAATHADTDDADEGMRELLKAYEVLSDPQKKSDYDRCLAVYQTRFKVKFNYREFLQKRTDDLYSQSRLLLHDLLNSEYEEALSLYEHLERTVANFRLDRYLSHEDTMDCLFLLAEAFESRGDYIKSCRLYKQIFIRESQRPYFHHFIDEVIERLRNLTCFKMVNILPSELAIRYIEELIEFNFSRKDNAFFYKKIAEIYCNMENKKLANHYLRKGLELDRKLSGVKKLKEKIGFKEFSIF